MFYTLVVASLVGVLSWVAARRPRGVFCAAVFFAGWAGLSIDVGLRVTPFRLLMAILGVTLLLRFALRGSSRIRSVMPTAFWAFALFAVARSVVQIPLVPEAEVLGGPLRSPEVRSTFQLLVFALEISPVIVAPLLLRTAGDVWGVGRIYVISTVLLALLGWLQLAFWYGTGNNPLPLGFVDYLFGRELSVADAPSLREGVVSFGGVSLYRMSSLGGEPKQLGMSLALALLLLQLSVSVPVTRRQPAALLLWVFLFVSMLLTLSTSGLFVWILGSLALIIFGPWFEAQRAVFAKVTHSLSMMLGFSALAMAAILTFLPVAQQKLGRSADVLALARARTIDRGFVEDFDAAVIGFLQEHPGYLWLGVGLGNAHLYADEYLPQHAAAASGTAFVAKSGYLRLVSELGVVGLALFLWWTAAQIAMLRTLQRLKPDSPDLPGPALAGVLAKLIALMCVVYLARGNYVAAQTFVAFGVGAVAVKRLLRARDYGLEPVRASS